MSHVNLAQVVQDREGLSADEDVAIFTLHFRGAEPLAPDAPFDMDGPRRVNAGDKIRDFLTAIHAFIDMKVKFTEVRWYEVPADGSNAGPAIDLYPLNIQGTGSGGSLPPQVSTTVSLRTDKRKNWGRFYIPTLVSSTCDINGRLTEACGDAIVQAASTMFDHGTGNETVGCVWSPTELTHHDPQEVAVDDVFDIIRSRRFSMAKTRWTRPVPA